MTSPLVASPGAPPLRAGGDRERFLTFAFAAAELLVEVTADGRIVFAAGAFPSRLGRNANSLLGAPAESLVAAEDRAAFATALTLLHLRGRLAPTLLRLADPARTALALSGLVMPGSEGRLALCFAQPPIALPEIARLSAAPGLAAAAEARIRSGAGGDLALFELTGTQGPITPRPELCERIGAALAAGAGPDALTGELSAGRFGLLADAQRADLPEIVGQLEAVLREGGVAAAIATNRLPLAGGELTAMQATRALRYALSAFAQGGRGALDAAGFAGGLAGFVEAAGARAALVRRALEERRFRLAFQPIVDLADRKPHHYEALLRPTAMPGQVPARVQDFVSFAETAGLSEELDWAVVGAVCDVARDAPGVHIACNLSGHSLQSPAFRQRLLPLLDADPRLLARLLIEITETAEIEDEAEAVATLTALRDRGLPLCLDDFGAGAAAFRYLRAFRVDIVKIDGAYVRGVAASARDRGFVAAMVDLARTVGAEVVAEQIETEAVAEVVRGLGVRFGQGWLFGRPGRLPEDGR